MSTWRYIQNGQTLGPVETADVQGLVNSGILGPDTLIWKEGEDPAPLRGRSEFTLPAAAGSQAPPPASASTQYPPPPLSAPPGIPDSGDIEQNKVYAILAYLGPLFLVPLLAVPNSRFARYHTNQGIILFIGTVVASIGVMVLMMIPFVGCIAALLPIMIWGAALVLMILGIVNAAGGEMKPLPFIGHYKILS